MPAKYSEIAPTQQEMSAKGRRRLRIPQGPGSTTRIEFDIPSNIPIRSVKFRIRYPGGAQVYEDFYMTSWPSTPHWEIDTDNGKAIYNVRDNALAGLKPLVAQWDFIAEYEMESGEVAAVRLDWGIVEIVGEAGHR